MTTVRALSSMAQIALQNRGQWHHEGLEQTLRGDIRTAVEDCAKLIRIPSDENEDIVKKMTVMLIEGRLGLRSN